MSRMSCVVAPQWKYFFRQRSTRGDDLIHEGLDRHAVRPSSLPQFRKVDVVQNGRSTNVLERTPLKVAELVEGLSHREFGLKPGPNQVVIGPRSRRGRAY